MIIGIYRKVKFHSFHFLFPTLSYTHFFWSFFHRITVNSMRDQKCVFKFLHSYLKPLKHIHVNLDSKRAVLYIIQYLASPSLPENRSFSYHHLPTSLTKTFFCYLPFVKFPSASTLGLMYNNMQLTSISFNFFPLKFHLLFKMFCFPSQNMWTGCKWK